MMNKKKDILLRLGELRCGSTGGFGEQERQIAKGKNLKLFTREDIMNKLLVLLSFMLVPGMAFADCRCASSTKAPYCTTGGSAINYTSAQGTNFSVTLGSYGSSSTYTCGQYTDKTVWVVGNDNSGTKGVTVSNTSANGWMSNPNWDTNHLDGRGYTRNYTSGPNLPQTFTTGTGPISFVASVNRGGSGSGNQACDSGGSRACLKYVDILTFVDKIPDSDGDGSTSDEFRPAFYSAADKKPGPFTTDIMDAQLALWPSLDPSGIPSATNSLSDAEKFFRHPVMEFQQGNFSDFGNPYDNVCYGTNCSGYGGNVALKSVKGILRLFFNDVNPLQETPRSTGRQAIINLVQIALDQYGAFITGRRWNTQMSKASGGWGGHWHGHKSTPMVAAYLLNDAGMKAMVQGKNFYENQFTYRSSIDGRVYYGLNDFPGDCSKTYTDNCASSNLAIHTWCAPKGGAGPWDSFCCSGSKGDYPHQYAHASPGEYLITNLLGAQSIWNDDLYLIWARSQYDGGRGPGHTKALYCGPSNKNNNTNNDKTNYYECNLCKEMWPKYKDYKGAQIDDISFVADKRSGEPPLKVSFTNTSTGSYTSWLWDFGDGNTSTLKEPTHTYQQIGTYTVKLTGTGTSGTKSYTLTSYIDVNLRASAITVEAENMTLDGTFMVDNGNKLNGSAIMVDPNQTAPVTGTATTTFSGGDGSYTVKLTVIPEQDGTPSVKVFVGSQEIISEVYPTDPGYYTLTTKIDYEVSGIQINKGDVIKIEGTSNNLAFTRVDKIVFTQEGTVVPVAEVAENLILPAPFSNPMQGAVVIPVAVDQSLNSQEMLIYDNAGNVVKHVRANHENKFVWDGTDSQGNAVPAGIYLYSVTSGGTEYLGKIVSIK